MNKDKSELHLNSPKSSRLFNKIPVIKNRDELIIKIGKNNEIHLPIIHFKLLTPKLFNNVSVPISRSLVKILNPNCIINKGMMNRRIKSGERSPNLANPV